MTDVDDRIISLDVTLFDAVPSQTYLEDRVSLLLLQRCIRRSGSYIYLEIGSHLGGTPQTHLLDNRCELIYSIDKQPLVQADEYGGAAHYPENSTERMLEGMRRDLPNTSTLKIRAVDCDARELDQRSLSNRPDLCFIDGEHTDRAVFSDFMEARWSLIKKMVARRYPGLRRIWQTYKQLVAGLTGKPAV